VRDAISQTGQETEDHVNDSADVLVIGGGIVGAASAYYLAKAGRNVVLLEAERLAYGATGRNLGFIWVHTRKKGPELDLVMTTRANLPELVGELGEDVHLRTEGGMVFYSDERQAAVMGEFVAQRVADGIAMSLVSGDEARELSPILPDSVVGATYCELDAQVEPTRWVRAFATAASRHGADIREGVRAERILRDGDRVVGVETAAGPIHADEVVLATGGWTPELASSAGLDVPIHPMRLQIVQTLPMPVDTRLVVYGATALKQYSVFQDLPSFDDSLFVNEVEWRYDMLLLESFAQKADGSYLLGCSMDYPGFVWDADLRGVSLINDILMDHVPRLREAGFDRAWGGILPFTVDNLPIIDRVPGVDGLVIAAGHVFGNGAGPTTGRLVASILTGEPPVIPLEPFQAVRDGLRIEAGQSVW
jgi:glycine/D-amino acid oxidase-like deaminating enzyme